MTEVPAGPGRQGPDAEREKSFKVRLESHLVRVRDAFRPQLIQALGGRPEVIRKNASRLYGARPNSLSNTLNDYKNAVGDRMAHHKKYVGLMRLVAATEDLALEFRLGLVRHGTHPELERALQGHNLRTRSDLMLNTMYATVGGLLLGELAHQDGSPGYDAERVAQLQADLEIKTPKHMESVLRWYENAPSDVWRQQNPDDFVVMEHFSALSQAARYDLVAILEPKQG